MRAGLACLVVGSFALRSLAALGRAVPSYFPDEYIYASISRSLAAHGRPLVRGGAAHFPALVEPLLAAPLWTIGSVETAYRLVQLENALFMSLAAVPAYLLARRLDLSSEYALFCAAFAVAVPDLAFSPFIVSDPIAYPLVLAALYAGVVALQSPSVRSQVAFVALAGVATLTRVQFVVLVPAFVAAAVVLDRRASVRVHRLPLTLFGAAAALLVALGPGRVLGYYSAVGRLHVNGDFFRWAALDFLFLALASGVALVPGAVVGLLTARGRRERAFSALAVAFSLLVMTEAAVYAANGSDRFKERYLFVLLPLLPIAFGVYRQRGRPAPWAATALATGIAAGALLLPLSGYVKGDGFDDSPLLWCFVELQRQLGSTGAALLVGGCAVAAAGLATVAAWTRLARPALAGALVFAIALSVGAARFENTVSRQVRQQLVAASPSWVDAAHVGPVAAIQTDLAPRTSLLEQLFWNRSIGEELLFGSDPVATDVFATGTLHVASDGSLTVPGGGPGGVARPLGTAFLFQGFAVTPLFTGAKLVARYSSYTLWRPAGTPRLRAYELGRYWDGWLAPEGGLEVWFAGVPAGTVSFTLSLPRSRPAPVTVLFGQTSYRLQPGDRVSVRIPVRGPGPWSTRFTATAGAGPAADGREVSLRSTAPRFTPA